MSIPIRVLILEDRSADAELMVHELRRAGFDPAWQRVEAESDYLIQLDSGFDVILADYALPQFDALHALRRLQERRLDIPFIIVSGSIGEEMAVAAMKQGAADYLLKDRLARLGQAVAQALEKKQLRDEKRRAEVQLRASLQEKELLLKEIHHRVKNNLQIISSLLNLQAIHIKEPQTPEVFKESQNRVQSMALIHEKLYQSEDLARIDFAEYARDLATNLFRSYGVNLSTITLTIDAGNVFLDIDTAIPCGLIINELVSNSLKYAFPEGQAGEIQIALRSDHDRKLRLIVRDNGAGFSPDVDFRNTESLGLQLVNTLTDQLGGTIELHRNDGTEFQITFTEGQALSSDETERLGKERPQ